VQRTESTSEDVAIKFTKQRDGAWVVDQDKVAGLLSLWTYNAEKAREEEKQAEGRLAKTAGSEPHQTGGNYIFLLGEKSGASECLPWIPGRTLSNWMFVTSPQANISKCGRAEFEWKCRIGYYILGFEYTQRQESVTPPVQLFECLATCESPTVDGEISCRVSQFLGDPYRFAHTRPDTEDSRQIRAEGIQDDAEPEDEIQVDEWTRKNVPSYIGYQYPADRAEEVIHAQHMFLCVYERTCKDRQWRTGCKRSERYMGR